MTHIPNFSGKIHGPAYEVYVLIVSVSSEGSAESVHPYSLARAFLACIHNVWMHKKTQTKIKISNPAEYFNMVILLTFSIWDTP